MIHKIRDARSHLEEIAYHEDTQTLIVTFRYSGATYTYDAVPLEEYDKLMSAESKGKHFCAHIKPKYQATKIQGQFRQAPDPMNLLAAG